MINKIIRNFVAKMVAGRSDDGIMITLRDPQKVEFQTAMMQDLLMRRGIDPNAIQSEAQLKMIINQIKAMEKAEDAAQSGIRNTESAKVFNTAGEELDPSKPIVGGTQKGKKINQEFFIRNAESQMPPPGSRGGPDDIAAPVQSSEETIKNMIEAENKKAIDNLKQKMAKEKSRTQRISGNLRADNSQRVEIGRPKLDEDEYDYYREILGEDAEVDYYPVKGDETKEFLEAMVKEQKDEMNYMKRLYDKGALDDPEDFAKGGIARIGYSIGDRVIPDNDFMNLNLGNMNQGQNTQTAGFLDLFKDTPEEKALEQIQDLRKQENQIKSLGEGAIELKKDELQDIQQQIQDLKQQYPDDESIQQAFDPYADIQGQTAFLPIDPFTAIGGLVKVAKGAKASALAKEFFKQKAKEKIGKEIYDKIQKKIKTPKYPTTPDIKPGRRISGGGREVSTNRGSVAGAQQDISNYQSFNEVPLRTGGRVGFFMGSKFPKGLATLREMVKFFSKGKEKERPGSEILRLVNPKTFNKLLEDPNIYRKFDVKRGIAAPDLIKNMQADMTKNRKMMVEEILSAAKNIRQSDIGTMERKKEIVAEMMKKGVDRETAEGMADTLATMAEAAAGKKLDTPKLTDEGILELENILKNMETGGKKKRDLNADGGRIGLKDGMNRRTFLKLLGGLASIPIIGKIIKPLKTVKGVKNVPIIKTDNVPGKPEWFDQLVNKVIIEGDDVTKRFATGERQSIHQKTLDDGSVVRVTEDVDDGAVRVEYESEANVFGDPVQMQYKKPLASEGDPRPTAEFTTAESGPVGRQQGPDDYEIEIDEVGGSSIRDLDSDVSKLKQYATGKGPTMKEIVQNKKRKDKAARISEDSEAQMDAIISRQGDYVDDDFSPDFARGGIARMLGE